MQKWTYKESRDLTGFIDGTENPRHSVAPEVVLIPEGSPAGAGGSVVLMQKWMHDAVAFDALSIEEQEKVIFLLYNDKIVTTNACLHPLKENRSMSEKNPEESLVRTWADVQQKMLIGWLDLVQGTEHLSRKSVWNETMKAWQSAVQETLDTQAKWLRDWTGRVQVTSGNPTDLRKNVQQAQVLLLRWKEAQQHLWEDWFHLVQQLGPLLEPGSQADEHLLHTLRESGQANINAQTEWVQRCTTDVIDR